MAPTLKSMLTSVPIVDSASFTKESFNSFCLSMEQKGVYFSSRLVKYYCCCQVIDHIFRLSQKIKAVVLSFIEHYRATEDLKSGEIEEIMKDIPIMAYLVPRSAQGLNDCIPGQMSAGLNL